VTGATRGTQGVAAGPAPVGEAEESDGSRVPASKIRALVGSSRRLAGQRPFQHVVAGEGFEPSKLSRWIYSPKVASP
jgi:hypothetical protein